MRWTDFQKYLPPKEHWPEKVMRLPELQYPEKMNAGVVLLDHNIEHGRGERPAIRFKEQIITYNQLLAQVRRLSGALSARGIHKGDRVLLRFYNGPEFITCWLALLRIGAVVVATMPLLKARELSYILNDSEAKAAIVAADLYEEFGKAQREAASLQAVIVANGAVDGCLSYESLLATEMMSDIVEGTEREDPALLAYTSGSTARPKGTLHTHEEILAIADTYAAHTLSPTESDVFGGHPTLAFTYGLGGLLVFPFRFGACTALLDKFTPEALLDAIQHHGVSIVFCTPTTYKLMLLCQSRDLAVAVRSLRLGVSAGEHLSATVYKEWKDRMGVDILDGIGSTEMLHMFLTAQPGHIKPGSTGKPVPGYEVKIVDLDMTEKPVNEVGLVAIKGPTRCLYWRQPERQREYTRAGWNIPGDLFRKDEDGYFWYHCRNDDLIICGGYNISGPEVESVLMEHPAVREVAVVASPDALRGSIPKAFVVLQATYKTSEALVKELQDHVKETLAPYKYPRRVEFIEQLPKTETGKIRRVELREREKATTS